jgi:hypothetical protein
MTVMQSHITLLETLNDACDHERDVTCMLTHSMAVLCTHLLFSTKPAAPPPHLLHHLCGETHATGIPLVIWLISSTALCNPAAAQHV